MSDDLQELDTSAQDSIFQGSRQLQNIRILQDKVQGTETHHFFYKTAPVNLVI